MNGSDKIVLEMLDEIDRARSGVLPLDELEQKLWRLLDAAGAAFPPTVAGRVEDLVLELRRLQAENLRWGNHRDTDPNRGSEQIFNDVAAALQRVLS